MDNDKAIRAAKLTLGGLLEKKRAKTAVERAQGQIAPSKYLPNVPRQAHADGGRENGADDVDVPNVNADNDVPPAPGQTPIPEDHVRLYHQTAIENIPSIVQNGLMFAHAKGYEGPKAIYADEKGFYGKPGDVPTVEFSVHKDRWRNPPFVLGDVEPSSIIATHLPWHKTVRYIEENDKLLNDVISGEHDNLLKDEGSKEAKAVRYIKKKYAATKSGARGYADGGPAGAGDNGGPQLSEPPVDLGQVREQKQLQTFHTGMMGDINTRMTQAMEAHQKALDAGHFDGYEVGDVLQGSKTPMRITGRYVQPWKPTRMTLDHFDHMGAKPTIIEHEGKQYIPMLRYQTGKEGEEGFQEGTAYLDGVRAAGYRKMGGLRAVKADGGRVLPKGYSIHVDRDRFGVLAKYNGRNVGQLTLNRNRDTGKTSAFQMAVHPKHQRKGLMSAMHDAAEEAFGPVEPDATLTDDGFAFWKGYRPDAVSNRLRFYQDKLIGKPVQTSYGMGRVKSVGDTGMNAELDDKDGATAWARAKDVPDMLRENGVDPDKITYADGGYVPQKTVKAYKLFRKKGDDLLPLFVYADKPVEMGKWLEAEEGPQGKAQGKVKSKLGDLAYRPGWHAGDLPIATHIGGKSSNDLKKPDYRPDDQVWAEVEMAADHDWQAEADSRGKGVKAHITDQVPLKGFYRYKTNPNMTGNWLIGGHMKVNRVLSDDEVKEINDRAGTADLPRLDRTAKADGGSVAERSPMFEGMSEHLLDEEGKPAELWHGTPGQPFEAFDDAKLGVRDAGFFGRGHYLTPDRGVADAYADPDEMGRGSVMGPLHAALKNPYVWDVSDDQRSHSTLRDLQSMGIMKGQGKMEPWDNLQRHHIDPFMEEMQRRGHDGVIYKTNQGVKEIVVFKPTAIKHRDAEVGDPNDPRIMRSNGGKVDLYSKAARVLGGLKDQPMRVEDIIKYALGKGVKRSEIDYTDPPRGGMARPSQVAQHIADMQPQVGVQRREGGNFRFKNSDEYLRELDRLNNRGMHYEAERLYDEFERFEGYGGANQPRYARYQLPGGDNYREHILTLDNHQGQTYTAPIHWSGTQNPLAHIRMSDRIIGNRKILHIEELQSDWNNEARKRGFSTGTEQQDYDNFVSQMRQKAIDKVNARTGQDYYDPMTGETAPTMSPMVAQAQIEKFQNMDPYMLAMKLGMQGEHRQLAQAAKGGNGVPRAPYINPDRDDASELAMKHVLTEAAKGGYDGIAFTPDAAQSERWKGANFNGIYDRKLPSMAQRLVRQHDIQGGSADNPQSIGGYEAPHVELTDKARQGILQNGFSSFQRGGYVTHVRRMR